MRFPDFDGALCAQTDPELFHPEPGRGDLVRKAKAICRRCPHLVPCAELALSSTTFTGVMGATTYSERRRMRRMREVAS